MEVSLQAVRQTSVCRDFALLARQQGHGDRTTIPVLCQNSTHWNRMLHRESGTSWIPRAVMSLPRHDMNGVICDRRQGCDEFIVETLVVALCVMVDYVFGYRCPKVSLTEGYDAVETLSAYGEHESFRICVSSASRACTGCAWDTSWSNIPRPPTIGEFRPQPTAVQQSRVGVSSKSHPSQRGCSSHSKRILR